MGQGRNFTFRLMKEMWELLKIKPLCLPVYYPQIDGLVDRFNKTFKGMLKTFITQDPQHWDQLLPALLFTIREYSRL